MKKRAYFTPEIISAAQRCEAVRQACGAASGNDDGKLGELLKEEDRLVFQLSCLIRNDLRKAGLITTPISAADDA